MIRGLIAKYFSIAVVLVPGVFYSLGVGFLVGMNQRAGLINLRNTFSLFDPFLTGLYALDIVLEALLEIFTVQYLIGYLWVGLGVFIGLMIVLLMYRSKNTCKRYVSRKQYRFVEWIRSLPDSILGMLLISSVSSVGLTSIMIVAWPVLIYLLGLLVLPFVVSVGIGNTYADSYYADVPCYINDDKYSFRAVRHPCVDIKVGGGIVRAKIVYQFNDGYLLSSNRIFYYVGVKDKVCIGPALTTTQKKVHETHYGTVSFDFCSSIFNSSARK